MPITTDCPHCGRPLTPHVVDVFGRQVLAGYSSCDCDGAIAERMRAAALEDAERKRRESQALDRRLAAAGVKPRYLHAEDPKAEGLASKVLSGKSLYLVGPVGAGKTHLACATARIVAARGIRVRVASMVEVLDAIKAGFGESDPMPGYQRAQVLVLDDLGKESPTDFALERLFALVDGRNALLLPTVVTTQYRPGRLIERLAKHGDDDTAVAIVSRLRQESETVELAGHDRRRTC